MSGIGIQLLDKHWRLVLGGTCALAIGVIALGFVAANHLGSAEVVTEATDSSFETPATFEVTPALPPILAQADVCLAQCNGGEINEAERTRIKLPYQFADLLKKPKFRAAFDALIAKWPAEYAGLAHLRENDRKDLPFEGKAEVVLKTPSGRLVQIYDWIGYPDREWSNSEELRRPEGILKVVVDLTSGEMVAIFNGSRTLSEYHFNGSDDLLAPLLAYMVADEFHMQKLVELDFPKDGPRLAFPLAGDDLANSSARLRCLGEHYQDGVITGTRTVSAIKDAEAEAEGLYWYSPNSDFTDCNRNRGPSLKLDEFVGHTDQPRTKDFFDSSGNLSKVEVINPDGYGNETVWTFYKRRADCEREAVNRNRDLADRYR
jgi:hypothetical protein